MIKKILWIFICFFGFLSFSNAETRTNDDLHIPSKIKYEDSMKESILSTPYVDASLKIYDLAEILTDDEEKELFSLVSNFKANNNLDLVILTINYNNKDTTSEYAEDFYDYNDFDISGVLFIIDMNYREFYLLNSGEAIFYFDDDRIESILSSADNDMRTGNYNSAIKNVISILDYYYKLGKTNTYDNYKLVDGKLVRKVPFLTLSIISFIVSLIVVIIMISKNKMVKLSYNGNLYLKNQTLTNKEDEFITSHVRKTYIPPNDSSSGSSHSGGISHGSSGMSHSGGGHKF